MFDWNCKILFELLLSNIIIDDIIEELKTEDRCKMRKGEIKIINADDISRRIFRDYLTKAMYAYQRYCMKILNNMHNCQ